MEIRYGRTDWAWSNTFQYIGHQIVSTKAKRILEIGGGANPTFSLDYVALHGLEYTVLDISASELEKAPSGYLKVCADITASELHVGGEYDLIFSRMLAEHVKDGETFHRNVFSLLAPNGIAFHFFPTLFALPFVVNRLLPETLAERVLHALQSGREKSGYHAKFPAFYSWCRGPMPGQLRRFERLGYQIVEYIGFFGHEGYYERLPFIAKLHRHLSAWLVKHPIPALCSFSYVLLRRP